MRNLIIRYAFILALLVFLLKFLEYRYIIRDLSLEFYLTVVGVLSTAVGVWTGLKLTRKKKIVIEAAPREPFLVNEEALGQLGISKREHEVLQLMALGCTNQEIADKLFVSLNTVKTHVASLFSKLDVKRRTQAVQRGKELRIIG